MAAPAIRYDGDFKQQTSELDYTPHFNTALEAVMHDRLATAGERILAWIHRNSWGRGKFHAVTETGKVAWQSDCAADLRIDKRRVSKVVKYLIHRGYLLDEQKLLYPVISPQIGSQPKVAGAGDFFTNFLPEWKVAHSTDFAELEVSRSNVVRIRKMMLTDYKKWKGARTSAEKSAAPAASERRLKSVGTYLPTSDVCRYVGTEPSPGLCDRPTDQPTPAPIPEPLPEPTTLPVEESNSVEKRILMLPAVRLLQKKFHSLPSPELLRKIVQNLQGAPLERFNARIEQRFQTVKSFGFLQNLALDVGNAYRQELKLEPPIEMLEAAQRKERQTLRRLKIEAWQAILADPNETAEAKQQARELLEVELKKE
jgi:hypothetical protein